MRHVAVVVATLLLLSFVPTSPALLSGTRLGTYDACSDSLNSPDPCVRIDGPTAERVPKVRLYLWGAAYKCVPNIGNTTCTGASQDVPGPGLKRLGVLYQDSNTLDGLQRIKLSIPEVVYPDTMLLV